MFKPFQVQVYQASKRNRSTYPTGFWKNVQALALRSKPIFFRNLYSTK